MFRNEQQSLEFGSAFRTVNNAFQRFAELSQMRIETLVFLVRHFGFTAQPDGFHGVERRIFFHILVVFFDGVFHADRVFDEVRIFADDGGDGPIFQIGFGIFFQMKDDGGSLSVALCLFDGVGVFAVGRPLPRLVGTGFAGDDVRLVGSHERGIETHAELSDQFRIVAFGFFLLLHGFNERLGAGLGDGADVRNQIVAVHADAVVNKGKGAGFLVRRNADFPVLRIFRMADGLETRLVQSIGCIRHQFPDENVFVGIDGMNHQLQQLLNFCLKLHTVFCHDKASCWNSLRNQCFFRMLSVIWKGLCS